MIKKYFDKRNTLYGEQIIKALEKRGFEAYYCVDCVSARDKALSLIPKTHSVSWGGSMTLSEIGLLQALASEGYNIIDRDEAKTPAERTEMMKRSLTADTFLMSSNAITEDGMLLNVDGRGNRVAALTFGPENVIVVVGINKVVRNIDDAVYRIKTTAAPLNMARFEGLETPCKLTGKCAECTSADCICAHWVVTRLCRPAKRIKVILVGEELGF